MSLGSLKALEGPSARGLLENRIMEKDVQPETGPSLEHTSPAPGLGSMNGPPSPSGGGEGSGNGEQGDLQGTLSRLLSAEQTTAQSMAGRDLPTLDVLFAKFDKMTLTSAFNNIIPGVKAADESAQYMAICVNIQMAALVVNFIETVRKRKACASVPNP